MGKKEYYQTIPDDRELIREYEKENKYWMILETDHPVYPYVEEDDSTRLYRRQADARDYLRCLGLSGLDTLYIEHDELPQMVSGWIPLGVRRIRIYDTPEEYRILQCDDIREPFRYLTDKSYNRHNIFAIATCLKESCVVYSLI